MSASATFALKVGVWFRRGRRFIVSPDSLGTACPQSGRNSTYRPVQISGASSDDPASGAAFASEGNLDAHYPKECLRAPQAAGERAAVFDPRAAAHIVPAA